MKKNKMGTEIFTLEDLKREKAELLRLRQLKQQRFAEYKERITTPLNIAFMIGKPLFKRVSWLPVALSAAQKVYKFIKNR